MWFVKLAIDRAMAETEDTRDKQHGALRAAEVATGAPRRRGSGGLRQDQPAVQIPPSHPPLVTDSERLDLSAEEQ